MLQMNSFVYSSLAFMSLAVAWLPEGSQKAAANDLSRYQYYQEITGLQAARDQLTAVPLDSTVYDAANRDYTDVRVVEKASGQEIPRRIRPRVKTSEVTTYKRHRAKIADLIKHEDNSIELIVEVPDDLDAVAGIQINTPLRNYERSITVYGQATDVEGEERLTEDKVLYDYSRFADVRMSSIYFSPGEYASLKIEIKAVTDRQASRLMEIRETFAPDDKVARTETKTIERRPFRVDSIDVLRRHINKNVTSRIKQTYQPKSVEFAPDEDGNSIGTITTWRQPLTELTMATEKRNFSRPAILKVVADDNGNAKEVLARKDVYDLSYRNIQERDTTLKFAETRARNLQLQIVNGEYQALTPRDIHLRGPVYEVVFMARPGRDYRLYYSAEDVSEADLDSRALNRLLDRDAEVVAAGLSERRKNPEYQADTSTFLNSRIFFLTVLVLMVAALGMALYSASKRA